jgi:hypothetical protein
MARVFRWFGVIQGKKQVPYKFESSWLRQPVCLTGALKSASVTDSPVEGDGFEPSVPREGVKGQGLQFHADYPPIGWARISARSPISVLRLFQTRAAPARRR